MAVQSAAAHLRHPDPRTGGNHPPARGEHHMASEQEILTGLTEIVTEITGIPADSVESGKSFTDDLDIDSLSMVEVVMAAEEKFGVKIPDDEVKNLKTVGDAVSYIQGAQA